MSTGTVEVVRRAVQQVVDATPALATDPTLAAKVRERMLGVSLAAAELLAEERRLSQRISGRRAESSMAQAQAAGDIHRRTAVDSAGRTLQALKDAVAFPEFVTSLITGVFQSIQSSNIQQLQAFADLLEAVNMPAQEFGQSQIGAARAAEWAANRFSAFTVERSGEDVSLALREDAEMPSREQLQAGLGATDAELSSIDPGDLGETLLPLVQRKLGRDRQAMLSTMLLMGLQRIVVDDGAIHASMRLQVDARSIAEQRSNEALDTRVSTEAAGNFSVGVWGASAKLAATVGYVKSDEQVTREDIGASAALRSSVDIRFRTLPLDTRRIANDRTLDQIRSRSMVPENERDIAAGGLIGQAPTMSTTAPTQRLAPALPSMNVTAPTPPGRTAPGGGRDTGANRPPGSTARTDPGATRTDQSGTRPGGTTLNPSGTTQNPSGTTQNPRGTTQNPSGTTQNPSGTTQNPSGTNPSGTARSGERATG